MIEKRLYRSINSIINDEDVDILEYLQLFTYNKTETSVKKARDLITYQELSKQIQSRGKNYLKEIAGVFNRVFETVYHIQTRIETYGDNAEELMNKIIRVLNEDFDNFSINDLTILNYNNVVNLSDLENGKYKERFAVEVIFRYTDIFINNNSEDLIKEAEFNLIKIK